MVEIARANTDSLVRRTTHRFRRACWRSRHP